MRVLILGYGYTAQHLWTLYHSMAEWRVTSRAIPKDTKKGLSYFQFHDQQTLPKEVFEGITHLLYSIPPYQQEDLFLIKHQEDLRSISTLKWVGYLSSTGVYGDHQGKWVDEQSPCNPTSQTSRNRYVVEQKWRSFVDQNIPIHIFRLSGIYGPGRSVFERIQGPNPLKIITPHHAFSRIHVEDIAQILWKSMHHPSPGEIYNVADNLPAPTHQVMDYACQLLGIPFIPGIPLAEALLTPHMIEFYQDRRRVSNRKVKETLQIILKYPTYREGLERIYSASL